MVEKVIKVNGMSCQHCVMAVKKELSKLPVESMDVQIGSVKINYDEAKLELKKIEDAIVEAGYKVVE